jgi:hypothetical protein
MADLLTEIQYRLKKRLDFKAYVLAFDDLCAV